MTDTPISDGRNTDGRFAKGNAGGGKPRGTRHRVTKAVEALLEGEAEGLTRKAISLALAGDLTALRLCLDRIAPARRDRIVEADLPAIQSAADHPSALAAIVEAVASGELTPAEGQAIGGILDLHRKAIETAELSARVAALEERTR